MDRFWDIGVRFGFGFTIGIAGWLWSLSSQVQANTFTVRTISRSVEAMPPKWLRDIVTRTDAGVTEVGRKLDDLVRRVAQIEVRVGMGKWREGK